jgi:hypothetical protein
MTGEFPEVGDRICDRRQDRFGTVTHILMWGSSSDELVIEWEDGTVGIRYTAHEDFALIHRRDREAALHVQ